MRINWSNIETRPSRSFICGHCGNSLASNLGYHSQYTGSSAVLGQIYICHHCGKPTFFQEGHQTPGPLPGYDVTDIGDTGLETLYREARASFSANAFTASVLCCRKILMHIAVIKGADPNLKFIKYVEYLAENHFIPPDAKGWVDHIRNSGNEANHEVVIATKENAEELMKFVGILLKVVFEFPAAIAKKSK